MFILLQMNPSLPSEIVEEQLMRVVRIKIEGLMCDPCFKCIHSTSTSHEKLKQIWQLEDTCEKKSWFSCLKVLTITVTHVINFFFHLFGEQPNGISLIWEYSNMMCLDFDCADFLSNYKAEFEALKRLTEFYTKFGTLPWLEENNN